MFYGMALVIVLQAILVIYQISTINEALRQNLIELHQLEIKLFELDDRLDITQERINILEMQKGN